MKSLPVWAIVPVLSLTASSCSSISSCALCSVCRLLFQKYYFLVLSFRYNDCDNIKSIVCRHKYKRKVFKTTRDTKWSNIFHDDHFNQSDLVISWVFAPTEEEVAHVNMECFKLLTWVSFYYVYQIHSNSFQL